MMRPKLNAVGLTILAIVVFSGISCNLYRGIQTQGAYYTDLVSYYVNDSLRFSYEMPGDYVYYPDKSVIRQKIKECRLPINSKYCIAYFEPSVEPVFNHFLFYFKDSQTARKKLKHYFEPDSTVIDSANRVIVKSFVVNNGEIVTIIGRTKQEYYFDALREEFTDIYGKIKSGEDYSELHFKNPFEVASSLFYNEYHDSINYSAPITVLESRRRNYELNIYDMNYYLQAVSTYYSFISNCESRRNQLSHEWRTLLGVQESRLEKDRIIASNEAAIDFLIQECSGNNVVMINENHFVPNHRYLLAMLLERLYKESGFRYLLLESLWENADSFKSRGFLNSKSGFYTHAPSMVNVINKASDLGYDIRGYDFFESGDREYGQAVNIYNVLQADSDAKIIVFAGIGHIRETNPNAMAARFKELSGVDPLTIDQTDFIGDVVDRSTWLAVIDNTDDDYKRTDYSLINSIDYELFAEKEGFAHYDLNLPDDIVEPGNLISIYKVKDYKVDESAVPVYNYLINEQSSCFISIPLPKDNYLFVVRNKYNSKIFEGLLQ